MDILIILIIIFLIIVLFYHIVKSNDGITDEYGQKPTFTTNVTDRRGIEGERYINKCLSNLIEENEYLIVNLLFPLKNGHETEVDCILITHKGIFCIETKNWVGHISGNDYDEYWIQKYDDYYMDDRKHRNPVKQNENHCKIIERLLDNKYSVNNIVLFPFIEDSSSLESRYTYEIEDFIENFADYPDVLDDDEIEDIYNDLLPYKASDEELKRHSEDVRKSHHDN